RQESTTTRASAQLFRIAEGAENIWRRTEEKIAAAITGAVFNPLQRSRTLIQSEPVQPFFAAFISCLRRASTLTVTRSKRLRASFDPVATFSMFSHASGLFIFWRSSFRNGWTFAKKKNISPLQPGWR